MTTPERTERKPLPSRDEIRRMNDAGALDALLADVERTAVKIEVDLEMEIGDDDWDCRARAALTAHRLCARHIRERLGFLSRGQGVARAVAQQEHEREKLRLRIERDARTAARVVAENAARAAKTERVREGAKIERAKLLRDTSLGVQFMRAAQERLDADVFAALLEAAGARVDAVLERVLPSDPAPSPEASG